MIPYKTYPIFIAVVVFVASVPVYSAQRLVPSQYSTIQAAVDAALDGDEIIVSPGTYTGQTTVSKSLIIRSTDPNNPAVVSSTIVDGQSANGCFSFSSPSSKRFELSGFTIQNASYPYNCVSLSVSYGTLDIKSCCFRFNRGPVISSSNNSILNLTGCKFVNNANASGYSSAVVYSYGTLAVRRSIFFNNYRTPIYKYGGSAANVYDSVFASNSSPNYASAIYGPVNIYNCTIADNTGSAALGGISSSPIITNSIFYRNSPSHFSSLPSNVLTYSDVEGGSAGKGNFNADPMFVDANNPDPNLRDYRLRPGSPCINAGDPNYDPEWGELDIDGQPRPSPYTRIDVGADEIQQPAIKLIWPIGSEIWVAKSEHKIKWQSSDITSNLNLYYTADAGAKSNRWNLIARNVANTGEYMWRLPNVNSAVCMLKIEPVVPHNNIVYTGFDKKFTIHFDKHYDNYGHSVASAWPSENKTAEHTSFADTSGPVPGCIQWQFVTDSQLAGSPVVGKDGNIYLLCISGKLYTLDPDGSLLWTFDANSTALTSPAIGPEGSIYFGTESGRVFAVNPQGDVRWTFDTYVFGAYAPAVSADNLIYFGTIDGTFYCLNFDGSEKWHYTIPGVLRGIASILNPPAIGPDGTVFFGGMSNTRLYAADGDTGQIKWTKNFGRLFKPEDANLGYVGGCILTPPVIGSDGTIYIPPAYDSNLYALNYADGSVKWNTRLAPPPPVFSTHGGPVDYFRSPLWSAPALGPDGTIYLSSCDDPNLRAVNPDGSVKWVSRLGTVGGFTLAVGSDGLIYAASDDHRLYIVDPNGSQIANFQGQNWLTFPVITSDHKLIIADSNSIVYCLWPDCAANTKSPRRPPRISWVNRINFADLPFLHWETFLCEFTARDKL